MSVLTWAEYQEATKATAIYPQEHAIVYTLTGALGELGEVLNLLKKVLRGDFTGMDDPLLKFKLIDEIGDVYWYIAQWMLAHGAQPGANYGHPAKYKHMVQILTESFPKAAPGSVLSVIYVLTSVNALLAACNYGWLPNATSSYCSAIMNRLAVAVEWAGLSEEDIWDANLKKLTGRKQANTLQGHNREDETNGKAK